MFTKAIFRVIPSSIQIAKVVASQTSRQLYRHIGSLHITPSTLASNAFNVRKYSEKVITETMTVEYDYVKEKTLDKKVLIVDVREPDEIKEHGKIPNSINIPLGNVTTTLSTMPEKEFQENYQRTKPAENTEIIFYCMIGKRSGMAQQNAMNLGYKNVKNYLGSWTEWATKTQ